MNIQIAAILSADGYLLEQAEDDAQAVPRSGKYGWKRLEEQGLPLSPYTSLIDLLNESRQGIEVSYLAETTPETMELVRGLLLYRLADEIILYVLPGKQEKGIEFPELRSLPEWEPVEDRPLKGGIRRKVYRRKEKV